MKIIRSMPCTSVFLGDRQYLHSTTIIPALLSVCEQSFDAGRVRQVSGRFHSLTDRQCGFDWVECSGKESLTQLGYVATFKLSCDGGERVVGLKPGDVPITVRHPFDEDALITGSVLTTDTQSIALRSPAGALLPTLVALNKRLHSALFGNAGIENAGYGKWLLTQLDLNATAVELIHFEKNYPGDIRLALTSVLASVNTKAALMVDEHIIGFMHFSRKREAA